MKRNFLFKLIGEAGLRLFATLFVLLLARQVGAADFGRYSSAFAVAALCIIFVDLGTNSIITREIARHPEERARIANSSHSLKMIAAIGSWLILYVVTFLLHFNPEQRFLTLCLGVVVIGQTLTEYFSALLSGIEEMGWEATLKILSRGLGLSLGFIALARHQSMSVIVYNLALGTLGSYIICFLILKYRLRFFGVGYHALFLKSLFWSSLPLFGAASFWILYDVQDVLLLNYFHFPQESIGWFSAAMKVIDVLRVYPVLFMGVFFPLLSRLYATDPFEFSRRRRRLFIMLAGSLTLLAAATYFLAPWIIQLLYKNDFMPASHFLRLLLPSLVLLGLNHAHIQFLITLNRERDLFAGAVIACLSNIVLAFLILPRQGVSGICWALFGSEIIFFLFLRRAMTRIR